MIPRAGCVLGECCRDYGDLGPAACMTIHPFDVTPSSRRCGPIQTVCLDPFDVTPSIRRCGPIQTGKETTHPLAPSES